MPLPASIVQGNTLVVDCKVQLVNALARKEVLHDIVPTKIPDTQDYKQFNVSVDSATEYDGGAATSVIIASSLDPFQWSVDGGVTWLATKFVCVFGTFSSVKFKGTLSTPSRLALVIS